MCDLLQNDSLNILKTVYINFVYDSNINLLKLRNIQNLTIEVKKNSFDFHSISRIEQESIFGAFHVGAFQVCGSVVPSGMR